jgi:hypothetical protein
VLKCGEIKTKLQVQKIKILVLAILLLLTPVGITPVWAAEADVSFTQATFEVADQNSAEVIELKKTLDLLRADLVEMKNGMKQLQTKMVESEMEKLRSQLEDLQKDTIGTDFVSIPTRITTPPVLKIEEILEPDYVKLEETEAVENEVPENEEEVADLENEETDPKILAKDAEIEKLKAALAAKEQAEEESAHAEVKAKAEDVKAAEETLAEIGVDKMVQQLKGEEAEPEEIIKPVAPLIKKPSNIIAQANGEILFQFPRSLSHKAGDIKASSKTQTLTAKSLTANLLDAKQAAQPENTFERQAAPSKTNWSILSTGGIITLSGMLGIAVIIFIVWLLRHERKLLAATSRRFQQLDYRPNFNLKSRAKKLFKRDKTSSREDKIT